MEIKENAEILELLFNDIPVKIRSCKTFKEAVYGKKIFSTTSLKFITDRPKNLVLNSNPDYKLVAQFKTQYFFICKNEKAQEVIENQVDNFLKVIQNREMQKAILELNKETNITGEKHGTI
jgi:hypothetical protein